MKFPLSEFNKSTNSFITVLSEKFCYSVTSERASKKDPKNFPTFSARCLIVFNFFTTFL